MNTYRISNFAITLVLSVFALALVLFTWRDAGTGESAHVTRSVIADAVAWSEPVSPLPHAPLTNNPLRVRLGEMLFFDPMLSSDDSVSCASCHFLHSGGADGRARSLGVGGAEGTINAPTVFNVAFGFAQFWDGRAATLQEQVAGPIHNPVEMNSNWAQVIAKLERREDYRRAFAEAYPEQGMNAHTLADALAEFEMTLVTPNARFDRYLRGEPGVLSDDEIEGYNRFKRLGCASCHQGVNIGGNLFQRFGVMDDYFTDRGHPTTADLGRFNVTGREEDRHVFKVPSLRNVALTAPYFHDGSATTLEDAVKVMGRYQLGRPLSSEDVRLIVAFLESLTGTYRGQGLQ